MARPKRSKEQIIKEQLQRNRNMKRLRFVQEKAHNFHVDCGVAVFAMAYDPLTGIHYVYTTEPDNPEWPMEYHTMTKRKYPPPQIETPETFAVRLRDKKEGLRVARERKEARKRQAEVDGVFVQSVFGMNDMSETVAPDSLMPQACQDDEDSEQEDRPVGEAAPLVCDRGQEAHPQLFQQNGRLHQAIPPPLQTVACHPPSPSLQQTTDSQPSQPVTGQVASSTFFHEAGPFPFPSSPEMSSASQPLSPPPSSPPSDIPVSRQSQTPQREVGMAYSHDSPIRIQHATREHTRASDGVSTRSSRMRASQMQTRSSLSHDKHATTEAGHGYRVQKSCRAREGRFARR